MKKLKYKSKNIKNIKELHGLWTIEREFHHLNYRDINFPRRACIVDSKKLTILICKHPSSCIQLSIVSTIPDIIFANQLFSCFHRAYKQLAHCIVSLMSLLERRPRILVKVNLFFIYLHNIVC